MIGLLAAALLPLWFTAPADTLGVDPAGRVRLSSAPVHAYVFYRLDPDGLLAPVAGYADSNGSALLRPHAPGSRETVWLSPGRDGIAVTIYLLSRDASGNLSTPSNGCLVGRGLLPAPLAVRRTNWTALDVPIVQRAHDRGGQAALAMVLGYYRATPAALLEVNSAYDPVLRGSNMTELAGAARRAGYEAAVETLTSTSVIALLGDGVPPILFYQDGTGSSTVGRYCVITAWDATNACFTLHDGTGRPQVTLRDDLVKRWETAGSQALVVRQRQP